MTKLFHGLIPLTPEGWPKHEPLLLLRDVENLWRERAKSLTQSMAALRVHSISGHEWECDECHYHMAAWLDGQRIENEICAECGNAITTDDDGRYVDRTGHPCDHGALLSRDDVLTILHR